MYLKQVSICSPTWNAKIKHPSTISFQQEYKQSCFTSGNNLFILITEKIHSDIATYMHIEFVLKWHILAKTLPLPTIGDLKVNCIAKQR